MDKNLNFVNVHLITLLNLIIYLTKKLCCINEEKTNITTLKTNRQIMTDFDYTSNPYAYR